MPNTWEYISLEINRRAKLLGGGYEYKYDGNSIKEPSEILNKFGDMGWELVSVVDVFNASNGRNLAFYFKRQKVD